MRLPALSRKLHRWGAIVAVAPIAVILVTGLLLLLKKEVSWIQPPTMRGSGDTPTVAFAEILEAAKTAPGAGIAGWEDVDRLDVRPEDGVVKVRGKNRMEVQLDATSGEILHVGRRRSDLIESIHDGSWFYAGAKLWIFLPCAVILFGLWCSGVYLWLLPLWVRRRRQAKNGG